MQFQDAGQDDGELRILLIGPAGSGKSSTGNSILGYKDTDENAFRVSGSSTSCTNSTCMKEAYRFGYRVTVVDTPGLYDTMEIRKEILKALATTTPGFHVIAFVMKPERYTEELKKTQSKFFEWFGKGVEQCALVVLTNTANNATLGEYLNETDPKLSELISRCNDTILPIDNKGVDRDKVVQLQELIKKMSQIKRDHKHFTNIKYHFAEMYARPKTTQEFKKDSLISLKESGLRFPSQGNLNIIDDKTQQPRSNVKGYLSRKEEGEIGEDDDYCGDYDDEVSGAVEFDEKEDIRGARRELVASGYTQSKVECNDSKLPGTEKTNNQDSFNNLKESGLRSARGNLKIIDDKTEKTINQDAFNNLKESGLRSPQGNLKIVYDKTILRNRRRITSEITPQNPAIDMDTSESFNNDNDKVVGSDAIDESLLKPASSMERNKKFRHSMDDEENIFCRLLNWILKLFGMEEVSSV